MSFKYWLPDKSGNGVPVERTTENNSVIIIGVNGSGKSRLGAWMERINLSEVHRISAQRSLNFQENIPLNNYSLSEDRVFYGTDGWNRETKIHRWGPKPEDFVIKLISDFDSILSALIAKYHNETHLFFEKSKTAENKGEPHPHTPESIIDKLYNVWAEIFPHRNISYNDGKFYGINQQESHTEQYSATVMSDGERSVLYFVAQVLCVPPNKTLIIDEPELHLHGSLMNLLWTKLENYRNDCLFVYITHDTQFASVHSSSDIIWVQKYYGDDKWDYEILDTTELPEDLLLQILGSRRDVLFVEGHCNSPDTAVYSIIYKDYFVVGCGSCTQVINLTKAFRKCKSLHHCDVYGIIDRDYRSEQELISYQKEGIFSLKVAEVENLFVAEEVISQIAESLELNVGETINKIKNYVYERFVAQLRRQVCQATVAELKHQLSTATISNDNDENAIKSLEATFDALSYQSIKAIIEEKYTTVAFLKDHQKIIEIFNEKGIAKSIGHFFGLKNNAYIGLVVRKLQSGDQKLRIAIEKYLPSKEEIPNG